MIEVSHPPLSTPRPGGSCCDDGASVVGLEGKFTTSADSQTPQSESREAFAQWALAQLAIPFEERDGCCRVQLPEEIRPRFGNRETVDFPTAPAASSNRSDTIDGLLNWLGEEMRRRSPAIHARPKHQPQAVSELTDRLFSAYQIDQGQVHLAGCHLEDKPFLRLSFLDGEHVSHVYVAEDGSAVPADSVEQLGMAELEPIRELPPRAAPEQVEAMTSAGRRMAAQLKGHHDPSATADEPFVITLIWLKYARGQLQFTVDGASALLPFEGWAKTLSPPPFECVGSGRTTYHLGATDDLRVVAAEAIDTCAHSGRRTLAGELVECRATGQRVCGEYVEMCPVLGEPVRKDLFTVCPTCRERVSRKALRGQGCAGCRNTRPVERRDPRLTWILEEHPGLKRWQRWCLSETRGAYIAQARGMLRCLLLVVDRRTLEARHLATGRRFLPGWSPVDSDRWNELLR